MSRLAEMIDTTTLEGKSVYFIGTNNKIHSITEAAIVYLVNKNTRWKLKEGMFLTKEEAEAKLEEMKGSEDDGESL